MTVDASDSKTTLDTPFDMASWTLSSSAFASSSSTEAPYGLLATPPSRFLGYLSLPSLGHLDLNLGSMPRHN